VSLSRQLGQFFTTNASYILHGFEKYIADKSVADPFAGNADLIRWAGGYNPKSIVGYDIDSRYIDNKTVFKNDSLKNPKAYDFVLTNPPYLYINKMNADKRGVFANSKHTDLYHVALQQIMTANEGIVIVPVNFLSADNAKYIRDIFFEKFTIKQINYFTEAVFHDTTYNVIAFYFCEKEQGVDAVKIPMYIFPEGIKREIFLEKKYHWQIGGEFLNTIKKQGNTLGVRRLVEADLSAGNTPITLANNHLKDIRSYNLGDNIAKKIRENIILLKAIDTGTDGGRICLEDVRKYNIDGLVSIPTSRNQVFLIFENPVSIAVQQKLIELFNQEISTAREKYFSLFMTNYRDKNRKRISFRFAYKLLNYLYENHIQ